MFFSVALMEVASGMKHELKRFCGRPVLSDFHIKDELSWSRRLVDMRFVLFFFAMCKCPRKEFQS